MYFHVYASHWCLGIFEAWNITPMLFNCYVSILFSHVKSLFIVYLLVFHRHMKSHQAVVLINLCVALIIANLIFLIGIDKTEPEVSLLSFQVRACFREILHTDLSIILLTMFKCPWELYTSPGWVLLTSSRKVSWHPVVRNMTTLWRMVDKFPFFNYNYLSCI